MKTVWIVAACLVFPGCYASSVVAPSDRSVEELEAPKAWAPATAGDLPGFWVSTAVEGDSAGAVLRAYYVFTEEGFYSGAALVVGEVGPQFLVLEEDGRWSLSDGVLELGDGSGSMQASVAEGCLQLEVSGSAIVFRRDTLD